MDCFGKAFNTMKKVLPDDMFCLAKPQEAINKADVFTQHMGEVLRKAEKETRSKVLLTLLMLRLLFPKGRKDF